MRRMIAGLLGKISQESSKARKPLTEVHPGEWLDLTDGWADDPWNGYYLLCVGRANKNIHGTVWVPE